MFPDKFRFIKIFILTVCLVILIGYAQIQGPKEIPGLKEFKNSPALLIGKSFEINGKIKKIEKEDFLVEYVLDGEESLLSIKGKILKGKLGDTINLSATYRADNTLNLEKYIISNSRPIKITISFVALLWVFFLFSRDFSFDFNKFIFRPKNAQNNF